MEPGEDVIRRGRRYDEMDDTLRARPNLAEQACRNLWAAVLAQAVEDYLTEPADLSRYMLIHTSRSRKYQYEQSMRNQYELQTARVTTWLFEDDRVEVGAFPWICEALGLDRGYVRQRARERKAANGRSMRTFMTVS